MLKFKGSGLPYRGRGAAKYDELFERLLPEDEKILYQFLKLESPVLSRGTKANNERNKYINLIVDYITAIRSTTLNNSSDPRYGPPLVRLWFGQLYENVPCICTSYSIDADVGAGYDKRTLLPRVIKVSMSLLEARNMGRYSTNKGATQVERDALAGWEYIVGSDSNPGVTLDPGVRHLGR